MINESSITAICRVYRLSLDYVPFGTRFKNITYIHEEMTGMLLLQT